VTASKPTNLAPFLEWLRGGYDLVMGNRFSGEILPEDLRLTRVFRHITLETGLAVAHPFLQV
jgi:hypothetical protein